ncbi:MAG: YihY/virulence factor BrkB family protein [Desulfobulbaceae bacterium]|uniref:YihY/virulence factor BrkB family protein n=1 Tax=Candidatus Desulfatifera sulfidica TaxID=2841691 RepID=A0A8J6T9P8_9BACT|nr:YihY/virulence factor BrkB family protein [Candidatus Desulfatifera sulfidica]
MTSTAATSLTDRLLIWADQRPGSSSRRDPVRALVRICLITLREFQRNKLSLHASALTYIILLSLVPMLAMSTALVKGLGGDGQLQLLVYSYIETFEDNELWPDAPSSENSPETAPSATSTVGLTDHLRSAADRLFDYVNNTNFTTLGTVGVVGIFISVILVFGNIEKAINSIWHVKQGRSLLRKVSDYLTLLILMPLSVNIGLAASTILKNPSLSAKFNFFLPLAWMQTVTLTLIPVLIITLTLAVVYVFFPNTKVKTLPALAGGLFAGSLWYLTQNLYISLQVGVAKYNAIYGSFATLPLFLIWIYLGWIFILTGAQIAYACQQHDYRLIPKKSSPASQLAAACDIIIQVHQAFLEQNTLDEKQLHALSPHCPTHLIQETTQQLISGGLLHHTDEQNLIPATPLDQIAPEAVISAIFGNNDHHSPGDLLSAAALKQAAQVLKQLRQPPHTQQTDKHVNTQEPSCQT